ncbi:UMF12 family major facilitator superfamily permease [Candidatus Mancarchaeum acidiphilum]|uniref:UMF12 family major facilitator superfamily permease n=1 Tax=Candidatus Mancarchaeum acidiphilum TaxID=1920749 RepID=A0A218NM25_9ARCH|nr:MFS transporter [Candidatus Mancarchaeum acidiphilum]ASI13523.1 UMF12 family major facilitator superfamily permease [Candidatus Mancarchaeum acidiphilum]
MDLDSSFKFLEYSRASRSAGIIFMVLAFPLYLKLLNLKLVTIGIIIAAIMLVTVIETLALGMFGDRYGYKYSLLIAELLPVIGAFLLFYSSSLDIIIIAMVITGLSGGAGGMRGLFSPGLTALIASNYENESIRVKKLGILTMLTSLFSILGSFMLASESFISRYVGTLMAYRYLFLFADLLLLISFISIIFVKEIKRPKKTSKIMKKESFKYISKIMVINIVSGVGTGISVPLLPLWIELMYSTGATTVGIIFGISYITTALGSYLASKSFGRFNVLNVSSITRTASGIILIAMALSPTVIIAGFMYILRSIFAGFGSPNRSALNVRGIDKEDYGSATSFNGVSSRMSQLSSGLSGYLMDISLPIPLIIGGIFQGASGILYKIFIKEKKK